MSITASRRAFPRSIQRRRERHKEQLVGPPEQGGPDRKSGSNRCQQDQIAFLKPSFLHRSLHCEWNCAGGGIPIFADVDDYALHGHAKTLCGGSDDALIRLMRDESLYICAGEAVSREDLF